MNDHVDKATRLLLNYFQGIARKAGFDWRPDYSVEVRAAVEEIVDAAAENYRPIVDGLTRRIAALEEGRAGMTPHAQAVANLPKQGESITHAEASQGSSEHLPR